MTDHDPAGADSDPRPLPGRASGRTLLLLTFLTAILAFFLVKPGITLDGISYFGYLRSAVQDGDLDLRNEFTFLGVARQDFNMTPEGHVRNVFPMGTAILWTPYYLVGAGDALLMERLTAEPRVDGYSRLHVFFIYIATVCMGLAALWTCFRFAASMTSPGAALTATVAVWLASPFVYYQFIKGDYSHVPSALCVALFVTTWYRTRGRRRLREYLFLGYLAGLTAMVRWQDVLVLLLPFLDLAGNAVSALSARAGGPRELRWGALSLKWRGAPDGAAGSILAPFREGCAILAGALIGGLPQLVYWRITLGDWLAVPQGHGFLVWDRPEVLKTLFSSFHGLFGWHPILFLSIPGLFLLARKEARLAGFLLLLFAVETYINSIVWDWEAGVSFGGRRFVSLTVLFVVGLAAFYRAVGTVASLAITALAVVGNLLLLHEFHFGLIDRRWFVSFGEIWRHHLDLVGRLPQTAAAFADDHLARQWPQATWAVLAPALLLLILTAWILAVPERRRRWVRVGLIAMITASQAIFVRAAIVTRPSPVDHVRRGSFALIDYRWYENGHYQMDPFRPDAPPHRHYLGIEGETLERDGIPFRILDPTLEPLANASAVTTCHLRAFRAELPLAEVPTRAVWLVLSGGSLVRNPGGIAARLELAYTEGSPQRVDLVAGRDVWDYWEEPPGNRILWRGEGAMKLTWFAIEADTSRTPSRLAVLGAPPGDGKVGPGVTVFAVTQETAEGAAIPIGIERVANTDFMQDPFRPSFALNHFPHLAPGEHHWRGVPYRILDVDPVTGRGTVITTAYIQDMRLKVPLVREPSRSLRLVLDGAGVRDLPGLRLGEILVHYETGEPERVPMVSGENVWDYWEDPPEERLLWRGSSLETLSGLAIPVDPARVPSTLELVSAGARGNNGIVAGYAIFAVTQELDAGS